jgi:hypothetical protein
MDRLHHLIEQTGVDNRVYKVYIKTSAGLVYKGCHSSYWMAEKQKAMLQKVGHQVTIHEVLTHEN